ncbi:hypothetical protein NpNSSI1_00001350 [Neofusicoccum parvum]|nr:hypothetical protein NpNSSI1_00001350 [Neofusicoccum parvum]
MQLRTTTALIQILLTLGLLTAAPVLAAVAPLQPPIDYYHLVNRPEGYLTPEWRLALQSATVTAAAAATPAATTPPATMPAATTSAAMTRTATSPTWAVGKGWTTTAGV